MTNKSIEDNKKEITYSPNLKTCDDQINGIIEALEYVNDSIEKSGEVTEQLTYSPNSETAENIIGLMDTLNQV